MIGEVAELAAACDELANATAEYQAAQAALYAASKRVDAARLKRLHAHEALERAVCATPRAALPTLPEVTP